MKSQIEDKIVIITKIRHTLIGPNLITTSFTREGITLSPPDPYSLNIYRPDAVVMNAFFFVSNQRVLQTVVINM